MILVVNCFLYCFCFCFLIFFIVVNCLKVIGSFVYILWRVLFEKIIKGGMLVLFVSCFWMECKWVNSLLFWIICFIFICFFFIIFFVLRSMFFFLVVIDKVGNDFCFIKINCFEIKYLIKLFIFLVDWLFMMLYVFSLLKLKLIIFLFWEFVNIWVIIILLKCLFIWII